tara:strand:- start:7116 stop:8864 length:1749 start_codon:yes stop_codon:yes gene_type:complete
MKNRAYFILLSVLFLSACVPTPKANPKKTSNSNEVPETPSVAPTPIATPTSTPTPTPTATVAQIDPLAVHAWHLNNTGQTSFAANSGIAGFDLNFSTSSYTGNGVLVAVSDNGVEKDHEDLSSNFNLAFSKNYSSSNANWYADPTPNGEGHGTSVSGIIGASAGNGLGARGIASKASIAGFKYVGLPINQSMQVDQANGNYDVFNYSYGGYSCYFDRSSTTYISQLEYGAKNLRSGRGAIYVKAAGNEYAGYNSDCDSTIAPEDDTYYLGNATLEQVHSYPWMVVVGAFNANGVSSSYSTPGSSLWISAPGGEYGQNYPAIITTDLSGCDQGYSKSSSTRNAFDAGSGDNPNCNYTSVMNGTSAATPMISGAVALLLEANPNLSWRDVKYILAKTAIKIDPTRNNLGHPGGRNLNGHIYEPGWTTNSAGYNFHNWYGFGAVDIDAATALATGYTSTLGSFKEVSVSSSANLNLGIPDATASGVEHTLNITNNYSIEAVQIKLNIAHPYVGDLGVELTSPAGTKSRLMNINSGILISDINDEVLLSNAFYGESSAGTWKIKVVDGASDDIGTLNNWTIKIYGY